MNNGRFSGAQIMSILKQAEGDVPVSELCRVHGMSSASFYKWRSNVGERCIVGRTQHKSEGDSGAQVSL